MKSIIGFIAGVIVFFVLIFVVDKAIVNAIVSLFPASAADWLGVIKVGTWFVILWFTLGLAFLISMIVGMIIQAIFGK